MYELDRAEAEAVLREQEIGRLGMYDEAEDRVYVVPISYVYHDGAVEFHSAPGLKLELLRAHPKGVCFQVDRISDVDDWRSVVGWGQFEEVTDSWERQVVLQRFGQSLIRGPLRDHQNIGRAGARGVGETVYRLRLTELSGKAESA